LKWKKKNRPPPRAPWFARKPRSRPRHSAPLQRRLKPLLRSQ
jgi:hypothetical protein